MDSELTADELRQIMARAAAATSGPWQAFVEGRDHMGGDDFIRTGGSDDDSPDMYISMSTFKGAIPAGPEDLDFIANARQDIPRLVNALGPSIDSEEPAIAPTDGHSVLEKGRVSLWLDTEDLKWLATHCGCPDGAGPEVTERCARLRFRANTALHKSGRKS